MNITVPPRPPKWPTAWSYSAFELWRQCPFKYRLSKLDKLPMKDVPAFKKGREAHLALAAFVMAPPDRPGVVLPDCCVSDKSKEIVTAVRAFPDKKVEQQWGYDAGWQPTGWFGDDTWLRAVLDVGLFYGDGEVEIVDWKTGKHRDENHGEMEVFALAVMHRFPARGGDVLTRLVYLDSGIEVAERFSRKSLDKLTAKWTDAVAPMLGDRTFPARPNSKCGWCDFGASKGGPCSHG